MTTPDPTGQVPWYGTSQDWSQIISGAGQGTGSAMQGASAYATSKREAKEAKRRTLSNLLNSALKRDKNLFRMGQEHADEMNEYQSNALQQVAKGFVDALKGSTG